MAPKAVEKKIPAKKTVTAYAAKEIDASKYVRKQEILEPIGEISPLAAQLKGLTANVESLYPEWSTENQNWQEPVEGDECVKYPSELKVQNLITLRTVLNLDPITEGKGKKGETKKVKESVPEVILTETLHDEEGRELPRVYYADDSKINEYYRPLQFKRGYSAEQLERKALQENLLARISVLDSSSDQSAIIGKKAELQLQYDNCIAERDVRKERPCGPELDHCMTSAFRIISEFAQKEAQSSTAAQLSLSAQSGQAAETGETASSALTTPKASPKDGINDGSATPQNSVPVKDGQKDGQKEGQKDGNKERSSSDKPARLLWNSIYPQLPSGRPVYNPAGKYAVRLFLAGKWRKVLVTDVVPVNADGVVLARSDEALELWPMLLAKAVYSVYTACGYNYSLPTLTETSDRNSISRTHKASFFIAFAVHILTGWQPSTPRCLAETIDRDIHRARGLLQEMLFGGATNLPESEIPSVPPPVLKMGGGLSGGDIIPSDLLIYQTKKQFKEEYNIRFKERERVIKEIERREGQALRLNEALLRPFSEGFTFCLRSQSEGDNSPVLTIPILGICLTADVTTEKNDDVKNENDTSEGDIITSDVITSDVTAGDIIATNDVTTNDLLRFIHSEGEEESDFNILKSVRLLTKWYTKPGVPLDITPPEKGPVGDLELIPDELISLLHGINDPLPVSTVIESEWLTLQELAERQAYIIGFDTNTRLPHQALLDWQWTPIPDEKVNEKGEKGDKEKSMDKPLKAGVKGKVAGEQFRGLNAVCGDMGSSPPLLLSLSTKNFFKVDSPSSSVPSVQGSLQPSVQPSGTPTGSAQATGRASGSSGGSGVGGSGVGGGTGGAGGTALSNYLSISLSVHADMIVPEEIEAIISPRLSARRKSTMKSQRQLSSHTIVVSSDAKADLTESSDGAGGGGVVLLPVKTPDMLPSDVVIILQELRNDGKEPLVMRIELSPNAKIPITRTTFHIPADRIDQNKDNLVFWVRLFSLASVHLAVSCAVPVVLGEVEGVWGGIGGSVLVREGEAEVTRSNTEQILFRIPLKLSHTNDHDVNSSRDREDEEGSERKGEISLSIPDPDQIKDQLVTAFLHISDREIARSVSMLLLSQPDRYGSTDSFSMPRIDGNNFILSGSSSSLKTLIGRCFPRPTAVTSPDEVSVQAVLPLFKWKLIIISSVPVLDMSTVPPVVPQSIVRSLQQRYKGQYRPNNRLTLFRDVYVIDHSSFPVALRITTLPLRSTSSSLITASATHSVQFGRDVKEIVEDEIDVIEEISFIVRIYRKSDRKLMSESKGCSVLQLYSISMDGLMAPLESTPTPATPGLTPDTPTSKGGKKDKTEKTPSKKGPGVGGQLGSGKIEFILECLLDEFVMNVPGTWRSRVPFSFGGENSDGVVNNAVNKSQSAKGKKDIDDKSIPILPVVSSLHPSISPNFVIPQFQWQVDVLAGVVLDLSHDTYDIERLIEMKNGWEEASLGRAERAIASMTFMVEKKALRSPALPDDTITDLPLNTGVTNSTSASINNTGTNNTGNNTNNNSMNNIASAINKANNASNGNNSNKVATDRLIDLLTLALEKEDNRPLIAEREARLLGLPEYKEYIGDSGIGSGSAATSPAKIEQSVVQSMKTQNAHRKESTEMASKQIGSLVLDLNEILRGDASRRINTLSIQANDTAARISILWEAREQYRQAALYKIQAQRNLIERKAADLAALRMGSTDTPVKDDTKDKKGQKAKPPPAKK